MKRHILSSLRFKTGKEVRWHHSFIYIYTVVCGYKNNIMYYVLCIMFSSHCCNYSMLYSQLISTSPLNSQVILAIVKYRLVYGQELQHFVPAIALVRTARDSARRSRTHSQ